jgi:hypothetical protein
MQSCNLVELAALISAETPGLLRTEGRFSAAGIDAYWTASKCRLDRWSRRLRLARDGDGAGSNSSILGEKSCWATCTEILTSEILTRVWTAAAAAADRAVQISELWPVSHSILFGHQEARRRVLNLIAAGHERDERSAGQLDQLRRVCERWTDLLLAPLAELCDLEPVAHNPSRAADFARDRLDERKSGVVSKAREILNASLKSTFRRSSAAPSLNADLNAQIASAIFACLNLERLEAAGVRLESLTYGWLFQSRVMNLAAGAESLVAGLLAEDRNAV